MTVLRMFAAGGGRGAVHTTSYTDDIEKNDHNARRVEKLPQSAVRFESVYCRCQVNQNRHEYATSVYTGYPRRS